jgi:hypothetical protein
MPISVTITLTSAGAGAGPFNLFSDTDSFTNPFEGNVSVTQLLAGYVSNLVPTGTTTIRVQSTGICNNYIDLSVLSPSPTASPTPSISISVTPTITPTVSRTPSVTPSISISPSITPSISVTPTVTPSLTVSSSPPPASGYFYMGVTSTYSSGANACSARTCGRSYYLPAPVVYVGQRIYNDSSLTSPFNGNNLWIAISYNCAGNWNVVQVDGNGYVINVYSPCP